MQAAAEYVARRSDLLKRRNKAMRTLENLRANIAKLDAEVSDLDRGAKAFGLPLPNPELDLPQVSGRGYDPSSREAHEAAGIPFGSSGERQVLFKDVALELLEAAHPMPMTAAQIREGVERRLNREFHEKTAGMTLYRLSRDRFVRRVGHQWFWVTPNERLGWLAAVKRFADKAYPQNPNNDDDFGEESI